MARGHLSPVGPDGHAPEDLIPGPSRGLGTFPRTDLLAGGRVPESNGVVPAGRDDLPPVGGEGQPGDPHERAGDRLEPERRRGPGAFAPELDSTIAAPGDDALP